MKAARAASRSISLQAYSYAFRAGSPCEAYILVVSGDVRVQVVTDSGRAVVLYHARDGDSCVLTTASLLGDTRYPAEGVAARATRENEKVEVTHEQLAGEVGSAREVISRHLKKFEEIGLVKLGRGHVEILDRAAMLRLAEATD